MAEMRDSLVAYLEITVRPAASGANDMVAFARHFGTPIDLGPARMEQTIDWITLARRVRERVLPEGSVLAMAESTLFHVGNVLVLTVPLDSEINIRGPIALLFHTLVALGRAQGDLHLLDRTSIRGVITRGAVHAGPALLLGPGVLTAQHQAHQARVPRIIVDPALLRAVSHDPLLHGLLIDGATALGFLRDLLTQDSDGLWFVHYLNIMLSITAASSGPPAAATQFLSEHARRIERALVHLDAMNDDALDWMWLASYHDRTVEESTELDEQSRATLRIQTDSPLRFRF